MMSIYNVLDQVIDEYIGFDYDTGESCDPELRARVVRECSQHIDGYRSTKRLCKEARACINQWEETLSTYKGE